jgi:hypothetical protein
MKMRGQSALEYLVTYGWAILAIVIIAAVLWYTGVFNPSKFSGGNSAGGFGAFTYIDQAVVNTPLPGNDSVVIVLGNALGRSITLTSGSLGGTGAPATCDAYNGPTGTDRSVAANGRVYIRCTDSPLALNQNDQYDWTTTIAYTDSQSNLAKVDSGGFVKGKVG